MFKSIKKEDNEVSFVFEDEVITRKVRISSNGMEFITFEKERYFFFSQFVMSLGTDNRLIKITEELKEIEKNLDFSWVGLGNLFMDLCDRYSNLQVDATSVPAGPDSSKFRATKSGFIRTLSKGERFGASSYSCGTYIHKGIQIGGAVVNKRELEDSIIYLGSLFNGKLKYSNAETSPRFIYSYGTNFSIYGIG